MKRAVALVFISALLLQTPAHAGGFLQSLVEKRIEGNRTGLFSGDGASGGGDLGCKRLAEIAKRYENSEEEQAAASKSEAYGDAAKERLDIFLPEQGAKPNTAAPIIIMVHGGAWCVGDKSSQEVIANKTSRWLPRGFIFVSVNYPMIPDGANVIAQAESIARAIAYIQQNAEKWGGDNKKIILMGHSAGAHLASLLTADISLGAKFNLQPWLGTVALDSAVLNVTDLMANKHLAFYDDAFGTDENLWKKASPFNQLSSHSLPWFGVCSTKRQASCSQAHAFADKAASLGIDAQVLEEDLKHKEINSQLGIPGYYTYLVEQFMRKLDPDIAAKLPH